MNQGGGEYLYSKLASYWFFETHFQKGLTWILRKKEFIMYPKTAICFKGKIQWRKLLQGDKYL